VFVLRAAARDLAAWLPDDAPQAREPASPDHREDRP